MGANILSGLKFDEKFLDHGIGARYFKILQTQGDVVVQVDINTGVKETRKSFLKKAVQVALEMEKHNLNKSDILAIYCSNRPEESQILLGGLFVGVQVAILDPEMDFLEFDHVIKLLKPTVIFCDPRLVINVDRSLGLDGCIIYTFKENVKFSIPKIFEMEVDEKKFTPAKIKSLESATAIIITTEGVSGKPKLVKVSHYALFARIKICGTLLSDEFTKVVSFYPLIITIFWCIEKGKIQFIPNMFDNRYICKIIHDYKIEVAIFDTDKALKLAFYYDHGPDYNLDCLKQIVISGFAMSGERFKYISDTFEKTIFNIYGVVECGFIAGVRAEDQPLLSFKPATCGKVFPGGFIKIADLKTNNAAGVDTWGELCFKGPTLASGYISQPEDNMFIVEDGFYRTGDIAQYDDQGCLYIYGRLDDIFISKGKVFSAMNIEEIVNSHPSVSDSAAYSNGRYLIVFVTMDEKSITSKELLRWVTQKLPSQMAPNKLYILNELPKTRNGKVRKYILDSIIARKSLFDFD